MQNTVLEIRESDYLIRLPKKDFDLTFVNQLIKRIQAGKFPAPVQPAFEEDDFRSRALEDERNIRFDNLSEK